MDKLDKEMMRLEQSVKDLEKLVKFRNKEIKKLHKLHS